jgi:hypothetical protein
VESRFTTSKFGRYHTWTRRADAYSILFAHRDPTRNLHPNCGPPGKTFNVAVAIDQQQSRGHKDWLDLTHSFDCKLGGIVISRTGQLDRFNTDEELNRYRSSRSSPCPRRDCVASADRALLATTSQHEHP